MNETEENDFVHQMLTEAMPNDLPDAVNQRMQNQLMAFRERLGTTSSASSGPLIQSLFRSRLVGWTRMAVGTAVILIAAFFISQGWHLAEAIAWADVTEAMAKRPWLHQMETSKTGTTTELWYSASRAIEGSHYTPLGSGHGTEKYTWTDFAKETQLYYSPDAQQIFLGTRSKEYWQSRKFFSAAWGLAFLSGNLGESIQAGGYEVVDQRRRVVTEGGRRCIEFRFRWSQQDKDAESVTQFVVLVDPKTRLPFRMDLVVNPGEEPIPFSQIDYPENGPADLYEMGVPKTAGIVDCSLPPDVERLAKTTVAAGCRDDIEFSALVVSSLLGQHSGYRVWKKGLRWKIDRTIDPLSQPPDQSSLSEAASQQWWRQQAEEARFVPHAIFDGKQHWEYSTNARRPNQAEIDAGADEGTRTILSTEKKKLLPWPRGYYWEASPLRDMGHPTTLLASPPMGLPIYDAPCLATINQEPSDGPPNTVMLELRDPEWKLRDSGERRFRYPQTCRFWIDSERDHLVMRCDELISHRGKEELIGGFAIEGLTQDPRNRWFPTVVRRRVHIKPPDNEKDLDDEVLRFYYDFDTPISDSLWSKID